MLHGARSSLLADEDGQVLDAHSISAGLDYPGVGPEHAFLRDSGRATYVSATDDEAVAAFKRLAATEGIVPALEPRPRACAGRRSGRRARPGLSFRPRRQGPRGGSRPLKQLAIYLMAGRETPALAEAAVEAGADLIEIGFPFSDPLADGPVIRAAAERALAAGMRTERCLECLAATRALVDVPLVPMTYSSLLEAHGYEQFRKRRAAPERPADRGRPPIEAEPELRRVQLVAPTTPVERLRLAAERTEGWLYLVSVMGTTGPRDALSPHAADLVARAREVTDVPLFLGFGISTPEQAAEAAAHADGVVVGTRAVQMAEEGPAALRDYVRSLRTAIDSATISPSNR